MKLYILIICISLLNSYGAQAQTNNLIFPTNAKIGRKFKKAIQEQTGEFYRIFFRDSAKNKDYSVNFMLDKIDNDSNYNYLFIAEYWIAFHYEEIIPKLIERIINKKEIGLVNYADLINLERIHAKQMKSDWHGSISKDDLFTIAGRANRLLSLITGENFGYVSMYSTPEDLTNIQEKWLKWLRKLNKSNNR